MDEDLNNPETGDRILNDFNRDYQADVGPLGGNKGMAVLKEMNDLGQQQELTFREGIPKINVL